MLHIVNSKRISPKKKGVRLLLLKNLVFFWLYISGHIAKESQGKARVRVYGIVALICLPTRLRASRRQPLFKRHRQFLFPPAGDPNLYIYLPHHWLNHTGKKKKKKKNNQMLGLEISVNWMNFGENVSPACAQHTARWTGKYFKWHRTLGNVVKDKKKVRCWPRLTQSPYSLFVCEAHLKCPHHHPLLKQKRKRKANSSDSSLSLISAGIAQSWLLLYIPYVFLVLFCFVFLQTKKIQKKNHRALRQPNG